MEEEQANVELVTEKCKKLTIAHEQAGIENANQKEKIEQLEVYFTNELNLIYLFLFNIDHSQ